jgi:hypothetical protein
MNIKKTNQLSKQKLYAKPLIKVKSKLAFPLPLLLTLEKEEEEEEEEEEEKHSQKVITAVGSLQDRIDQGIPENTDTDTDTADTVWHVQ